MARTATQDPLKVFRFRLSIQGFVNAAFSEVTGMKKTTDIAEIRHGGDNETPQKSPGLSKYDNITLKKGLYLGNAKGGDDDFITWVTQVASVTVQGNLENFRRDVEIHMFHALMVFARGWRVYECFPAEEVPMTDLNGLSSDNAFETLVLANEGYDRITSPGGQAITGRL